MQTLPKNEHTLSKLHIHSFGIAANDLPLNSKILEVIPVEDFPMLSGTLTNNASQYQAAGVNAQGQSYSESVLQSPSVSAEWMPLGGSNRMTPPNIRAGERLTLWRMGDSDKYYWMTLMDDLHLRKLETVIYAWSGSTSQSGSQANTDDPSAGNSDSSYFFEVSTHNKLMHLHTSKANGELCSFDVQVNPGTGVIQIQDDIGNFFLMDAINRMLTMQTSDGAVVQLDKKDLNFQVPGTWKVNAQNVDWTFGQASIRQESLQMTSGQATHTGPWTENGPYQLNGDMTTAEGSADTGGGTGRITIAGQTELLGDMDVKGDVTAVTIEATQSITAPNLQYN